MEKKCVCEVCNQEFIGEEHDLYCSETCYLWMVNGDMDLPSAID